MCIVQRMQVKKKAVIKKIREDGFYGRLHKGNFICQVTQMTGDFGKPRKWSEACSQSYHPSGFPLNAESGAWGLEEGPTKNLRGDTFHGSPGRPSLGESSGGAELGSPQEVRSRAVSLLMCFLVFL